MYKNIKYILFNNFLNMYNVVALSYKRLKFALDKVK